MEDYLLSNGFREKLNEKMMAFLGAKLQNDESRAILGAMFEARAEYLQAAIDEVKSNMVQLKRMLKSTWLYERVVRTNESFIVRR